MPFGYTHTTLRALAKGATVSFFSRVHVDYTDDNVPVQGPVIVVANHHNSAVDPAMLSCFFPHNRKLHYWAKSTLFRPGLARTILLDAGNIPVDRKTKDNQKLFATTFDVLKQGECVAVFPEGGSETMTSMAPLKDGASWAALEYATNVRTTGRQLSDGTYVKHEPQDVVICIAGIKFGSPLHVAPYLDEFETNPKAAVKRLTRDIAAELTKLTINAPDWYLLGSLLSTLRDTLHAATMARKMLWVDEQTIPLNHYRDIMQTLVDLFATAPHNPKLAGVRDVLLAYQQSLRTCSLTHSSLTGVPLPAKLDPAVPHPFPTRFKVLMGLMWSTCASLSALPFFVVPLVVHLPVYLVGKYSLRFSDVDEDIAQNKISLGLVLAIIVYLSLFAFVWTLLVVVPLGGVLAAFIVWLFVVYHNILIDGNYNKFKALRASWLVLLGIWAPHARQEAVLAIHRNVDRVDAKWRQVTSSPSASRSNSRSASRTRDGPARSSRDSTPNDGGERDTLLRSILSPIEYERRGENDIRRVLRLRAEASRALDSFFAIDDSLQNDQNKRRLREQLVAWGALLPVSRNKERRRALSR
ncbi:hypothetical protein OIV83_004673 [Microbotryomycetes sp. JL201]|nr:hypothetical protein OIV83_004673 [Microbotryomycetes sp. JL201]